MNNSVRVSIIQRVGNLDGNVYDLVSAQRFTFYLLVQRQSLDVFHRDKRDVFSLSDFVNCRDVGVTQSGGGSRFVLKSTETLGIFSKRGRKEFKSDLTTETSIISEIDFAHAPSA